MEISSVNPIMSERERKMKTLMSYSFAAFDLALYLNTHPTDKKALELHADMVKKAKEANDEFVKEFGPISTYDCTSTEKWCWIDDPWPWEA